jgi:uncharacterized damage-inducible protein DinB
MTIAEQFAQQLEREGGISKKLLERVPEGKADWKPHEKSMALGYLAQLVATMPGWVAMMIQQDSLDLQPPGGGGFKPPDTSTRAALVAAGDQATAGGVAALRGTTDAHLETRWQLKVAGNVVAEDTRRGMIADSLSHLAHHRGQLSVYLRLLGVPVPSMYGPSADERPFL